MKGVLIFQKDKPTYEENFRIILEEEKQNQLVNLQKKMKSHWKSLFNNINLSLNLKMKFNQ